MNKNLLTSVAVFGLALASPAFAQQDYTFREVPVPEDQVAKIQAQCDVLYNEQNAAGASTNAGATTSNDSSTSGSTGSDAAATTSTATDAAGVTTGMASDANAATSTATTETDAAGATAGSDTNTDVGANAGDGVGSSPVGNIDFSTLDVSTITLEDCNLGGFTSAGADDTTGNGAAAAGGSTNTDATTSTDSTSTDAGASTSTTTTTSN